MRKFYLEKETGERLDLQSKPLRFLLPEGMGFGENRNYAEVEYGFFAESGKEYMQPEITGTLKFYPGAQDPYTTYADFVNWVQLAQEIKLVYQPTQARELYMDVSVDLLSLSEKTLMRVLECPVTFRGTSPFHKRNPLTFIFESNPADNPMRFDFCFPFVFAESGSGGGQEFTTTGHFPAAIELFINGPVSKPMFKVENKNTGEIYGVLDLSMISVADGDQIYYSSRPNIDGAWKVSGGVRTDIVELLNINENNFFSVPAWQPCIATLTADVDAEREESIKHIMRIHEYYKG